MAAADELGRQCGVVGEDGAGCSRRLRHAGRRARHGNSRTRYAALCSVAGRVLVDTTGRPIGMVLRLGMLRADVMVKDQPLDGPLTAVACIAAKHCYC